MHTQLYTPQITDAKLVILESNQVRTCSLGASPIWKVGRNTPNAVNKPDIALSSMLVSREHGWIQNVKNRWYYVDSPQNTNGTIYNGVKIPRMPNGTKQPVPLSDGDILRVDTQSINQSNQQSVVMLFTTTAINGKWSTFPLNKPVVNIGRNQRCDIVLPQPYISSRHAVITYERGRFFLADCESTAGTFLNGSRVIGKTPLKEKDCFSICDCNFFFLGNTLLYVRRNPVVSGDSPEKDEHSGGPDIAKRPVILRADIMTKQVKNHDGNGMKELIRDIHLEIREGTLVALLGTAGAGKTTAMNCLNGMDLEGVKGSVIYRGVDLMKNFEQMKSLIGSVPQEKTFHPDFTPEKEFYLAAKKRLPADISKKELDERVDNTLKVLGINGVRKTKNSKLSGGEKTRVNIGIELVADRDLLCLDEPDQGLDPKYKHEVFQIMRNLAHEQGKSILSIIHDVSEIDLFDQVIMLVKADGVGRLAFSGSPEEMRRHFGVTDIREVYGLLEKNPKKYVI